MSNARKGSRRDPAAAIPPEYTDELAAISPGAEVIEHPTLTAAEAAAPERTSWYPIDLDEALSGADVPPPVILHRSDGIALLYRGRTHTFSGESESCKTWAANLAAVEVLTGGGMVLWVDYEDDERGAVSRLLALGVARDAIRSGFHYVRPEEPLVNRQGQFTAAYRELAELLEAHHYELAVIDGVTEGMVTEGLDPLGTEDAAIFARRVAKRIAGAPSSPAVVSIDHVPKSPESRGRYSLGSQHKLAGLTGASYLFEARKPLGRASTEPIHAVIDVKSSKDRPGHVRGACNATESIFPVGVLELTAYPDGGITGRLVPPGEATSTVPPSELLIWIGEHLEMYPGATTNVMHGERGGDRNKFSTALKWLVSQGYLTVEKGPNNSNRHHLTAAGRAFLGDL